MLNNMLESSNRNDYNKWSNIGFGEEMKQLASIKVMVFHLIWSSLITILDIYWSFLVFLLQTYQPVNYNYVFSIYQITVTYKTML